MPETSSFVAQMSDISGIEMTSILQVEKAIKELLQLLGADSVAIFLENFDAASEQPEFTTIKDSSFIEMSEIAPLVLGRKIAFNQNRKYYNLLAHKILEQLSSLRTVLEQQYLLSGGGNGSEQGAAVASNRTLVYLAWSYVLYQNYMVMHQSVDYSVTVIDPLSSLYNAMFGQPPMNLDLAGFNEHFSRFLLKWRFILTRMQGSRDRFFEAFQIFIESQGLELPELTNTQIPEECFAFLKKYDFSEVHDFSEMVLTYIMPSGNMCLLEGAYTLEFFVQGAIERFKTIENEQYCLEEYMVRFVWQDFQRFTMNISVVDEPELLAVLLVFILTGKLEFFNEQSIVTILQQAFADISTEVSALEAIAFSAGDAINVLLRREDLSGSGIDFEKKHVRTGFNSQKLKELVLNQFVFGAGKNVGECLLNILMDVYCRLLSVYAQDVGLQSTSLTEGGTSKKQAQELILPLWERNKPPFSLLDGLSHYIRRSEQRSGSLVINTASEYVNDEGLHDPPRISEELERQAFGFVAESPEECAARINASIQEEHAISTELEMIGNCFEELSSKLLDTANEDERAHFNEIVQEGSDLEHLIKACNYLINTTKKSSIIDERIPNKGTGEVRLEKIFAELVDNPHFHQYDANQVAALQQAIAEQPISIIDRPPRPTSEVLSEVFTILLAKTENATCNTLIDRADSMLLVSDEFHTAKAIPKHQFDRISEMANEYVELFGQEHIVYDHALLRRRIHQDANEMMVDEDDAVSALFVLECYAGMIGCMCEYGSDGVAVRDSFTGKIVQFNV